MENLRNNPKKTAHEARTTLIADKHLTAVFLVIDTFSHTSPDESLLLLATLRFRPLKGQEEADSQLAELLH